MSKLEELIARLCPDGVEYKRLEECCSLQKGKTPIQKAVPGEYPLVVTTSERKTSVDYQFDKPAVCIPLVSSRGHGVASLNEVFYQEGKFALGNILCGVTPLNEEYICAKFLYYYLNDKKDILIVPLMKGGANVSLTVDTLKRVRVPVPPIELQKTIVNFLDYFVEYGIELAAELAARQKQYEWYLMNVLKNTGKLNCYKLPLGDIYDFKYGKGNNIPTVGGPYPIYGGNGICGWHNEYNSEDAPVIGHIGAYAGLVKWASGKHFVTYNGVICKHKNKEVLPRMAYYLLLTQNFLAEQKGAQPFVSYDSLKKPIVDVPKSLSEQQRIVDILDRFDALCNDITNGLPAEIEARRKQYEYYRDKLLTFKELKKEA